MKTKYLILGAGPAGLAFANKLREKGADNYLVLEQEAEAGGLCRSANADGYPLDTGGGHFLDVRRPKVNEFLFRFMPEKEWNLFERNSQIETEGIMIGHPFEANIWQMPQEMQIRYLKSIAVAGCNLGLPMPVKFTEWIQWKLGKLISEKYMIPYNSKMFGKELDELGTYWLDKLPNVSFEETLMSCLNRKPYGEEPGHAQFFYPAKYGYGELWKRMADELGNHIIYNACVKKIDFENRMVLLDSGDKFEAETIIVTIPWTAVECIGMPQALAQSIGGLKHTSVNIRYFAENMDTKAQWIYYPDDNLSYHRILVRSNFAIGSSGYWTETNSERDNESEGLVFKNPYAYPLNTISKPSIMENLLEWTEKRNVFGLGRWGEWQHYNSDAAVEKALKLADFIMGDSNEKY